jgi:hypothetical protein
MDFIVIRYRNLYQTQTEMDPIKMEIEQQIESSPVIINTAAFALQVTY